MEIEIKPKSYFLRTDIATYKPKFVMVCYPTTFEVLRFKNTGEKELIVTKTQ